MRDSVQLVLPGSKYTHRISAPGPCQQQQSQAGRQEGGPSTIRRKTTFPSSQASEDCIVCKGVTESQCKDSEWQTSKDLGSAAELARTSLSFEPSAAEVTIARPRPSAVAVRSYVP